MSPEGGRSAARLGAWAPAAALLLIGGFLLLHGSRVREAIGAYNAPGAVSAYGAFGRPVPAPLNRGVFLDRDRYASVDYAARTARGETFRVRRNEQDNHPFGREVHWSSGLAWALATAGRVGAALLGGAGFWVSALTQSLVTAIVCAVAAAGSLVVTRAAGEGWLRNRPGLWRLWGRVGAAVLLGFSLSEYFPGHLGWRLEVNHPLYALAWWGCAELLASFLSWRAGEAVSARRRGLALAGAAGAAVAAIPLRVCFGGIASQCWENLEGLRAAADSSPARTDAEALGLIRARRVTHVAQIRAYEPCRRHFELKHGRWDPNEAFTAFGAKVRVRMLPPWLRAVPTWATAPEFRGLELDVFSVDPAVLRLDLQPPMR